MSRHKLLRSLIAFATYTGENATPTKTAKEILEAAQREIWSTGGVVEGKVLISTTEAGGTSTFAIPAGWGPLQAVELLQDAIDQIDGRRSIRRLQANFSKAQV